MERRITRREAAEILGTSYSNVRRLEREGQLTSYARRSRHDAVPARGRGGAGASPRAVDQYSKGELASRVFRMFKRNMTFADVVIESEQEPDTIRALWRCYTIRLRWRVLRAA